MANDNEEIVDIPEIPQIEEGQEDSTDWKAEALKYQGIAKRFDTKLKKLSEPKSEEKPIPEAKPQDKKEFDLAEETYLLTKGIKESNFDLVLEEMKSSGKDLKTVINSKYFKEKLEQKASEEALPTGTKRGTGGARSSVDFWLSKGELPPKDGTEATTKLRRDIVKARGTQEENVGKFTSQPFVGT